MSAREAGLVHVLFDGVKAGGFQPGDEELFANAPQWVQQLYWELKKELAAERRARIRTVVRLAQVPYVSRLKRA